MIKREWIIFGPGDTPDEGAMWVFTDKDKAEAFIVKHHGQLPEVWYQDTRYGALWTAPGIGLIVESEAK